MKLFWKWGTRNFTLRRKVTWSFTFRPRDPCRSLWDNDMCEVALWDQATRAFHCEPNITWRCIQEVREFSLSGQDLHEASISRRDTWSFGLKQKRRPTCQPREQRDVWSSAARLENAWNCTSRPRNAWSWTDKWCFTLRPRVTWSFPLRWSNWNLTPRFRKTSTEKRNVDKMVWPAVLEDWPPLPCMQSQSSV